jgi:hypothetical protein
VIGTNEPIRWSLAVLTAMLAQVVASGGATAAPAPAVARMASPTSTVQTLTTPVLRSGVDALGTEWGGPPVVLSNGDIVNTVYAPITLAGCTACFRANLREISPAGRKVWNVVLPRTVNLTSVVGVGSRLFVAVWPYNGGPEPPSLVMVTTGGVATYLPVPVPASLKTTGAQYSAQAYASDRDLFLSVSWQPNSRSVGPGLETIAYSPTGKVLWVRSGLNMVAVGAGGAVAIVRGATDYEAVVLATGRVLWTQPFLTEPAGAEPPSEPQFFMSGPYTIESYRDPYNAPSVTYVVHAMDGASWTRKVVVDGGMFSGMGPVAQGGSAIGCTSPLVQDSPDGPATCTSYALVNGSVTGSITIAGSAGQVVSTIAASPTYLLLAVAKGPWTHCSTGPNFWDCTPSGYAVEVVDRKDGAVVTAISEPAYTPYTYDLPDGSAITLPAPGHEWVWGAAP